MKISALKTKVAAAAVLALLAAGPAYAVTQTVTANVAFDTPLTITGTPTISFGTVKAQQAETYTISTAGTVTATGNAANILYGSKSAASLTVAGSGSQAISITANNYTANGGATPSAATCNYDAGGEAACSSLTTVGAPGAGKTLLVGVQLAVTNAPTAGSSAAPMFDIVVAYN